MPPDPAEDRLTLFLCEHIALLKYAEGTQWHPPRLPVQDPISNTRSYFPRKSSTTTASRAPHESSSSSPVA